MMFEDDPAGFDGLFGFAFGLIVVMMIGTFAFQAFVFLRNHRAARESGHDIFTLPTDLATSALNSELLAGERSIEQRLAELDDLRSRGGISDEEHAAARAAVLAD